MRRARHFKRVQSFCRNAKARIRPGLSHTCHVRLAAVTRDGSVTVFPNLSGSRDRFLKLPGKGDNARSHTGNMRERCREKGAGNTCSLTSAAISDARSSPEMGPVRSFRCSTASSTLSRSSSARSGRMSPVPATRVNTRPGEERTTPTERGKQRAAHPRARAKCLLPATRVNTSTILEKSSSSARSGKMSPANHPRQHLHRPGEEHNTPTRKEKQRKNEKKKGQRAERIKEEEKLRGWLWARPRAPRAPCIRSARSCSACTCNVLYLRRAPSRKFKAAPSRARFQGALTCV